MLTTTPVRMRHIIITLLFEYLLVKRGDHGLRRQDLVFVWRFLCRGLAGLPITMQGGWQGTALGCNVLAGT